jgi:hypothetical protein
MARSEHLRKTTPRRHPGGRPPELDRPGKYAYLVDTVYMLRAVGDLHGEKWSLRRIQDWLNANRKALGEKPWADPRGYDPDAPHYRRAAEWVGRGRVRWERERAQTAAALGEGPVR